VGWWGLPLLLLLAACAGPGGQKTGRATPPGGKEQTLHYRTPIQPPDALGGDFAMEQQVTMKHPRGENSFHGVLQKKGDRLVLVGLAPHGGRAFVLEQKGTEFTFESHMPRELPFDPKFMMHDVHRVWFLTEADQGELEQYGEQIEVERKNGRITRKRYRRFDGRGGPIVVRYPGGLPSGAPGTARPPDRVQFDNGRYGYSATIETLSWQSLDQGAAKSEDGSEDPTENPGDA
jgi:hypothetical protein